MVPVYVDRESDTKKENSCAFGDDFKRAFPSLSDTQVLLLDGPELRSSDVLIKLGVTPKNITVVEHNEVTCAEQRRKGLRINAVGPMKLGAYLDICPDNKLPDGTYYDATSTWPGNNQDRPLDDIYKWLDRCRKAGKEKLVLALTLAPRNNYQRQKNMRRDIVDILQRSFNGKGLRGRPLCDIRETEIVDVYLRSCVFPHSGWTVRSGWSGSNGTYQRDHLSQTMAFRKYILTACKPDLSVDWPFIDGYFVGFPSDPQWDVHHVQSLVDH